MDNIKNGGKLTSIFLVFDVLKRLPFNDDKECDVVVVDNSNKKIYQTTYSSLKEGNSSNNLMIEYAIVSYVTLQNEEEGLFFCSNRDAGVKAITTKFTDFEGLKKKVK